MRVSAPEGDDGEEIELVGMRLTHSDAVGAAHETASRADGVVKDVVVTLVRVVDVRRSGTETRRSCAAFQVEGGHRSCVYSCAGN